MDFQRVLWGYVIGLLLWFVGGLYVGILRNIGGCMNVAPDLGDHNLKP